MEGLTKRASLDLRTGPWVIPAAVAFAAALVAFATGWSAISARQQAIDDTAAQITNLTRAFASEAARSLAEVRLLLDDIASEIAPLDFADPRMEEIIHHMLARRSAASPVLEGIVLVDVRGIAVASSRLMPETRVSVGDRVYFQYHREDGSREIRLWPAVQNRLTDRTVIPVTRRLASADGTFLGVMVGSVSAGHFSTAFASVDLGPDARIRLVGSDGLTVAANSPDLTGEAVQGFSRRDRPFEPQRAGEGGQRLFVIGPVADTDYFLSIGIGLEHALRNWSANLVGQASVAVFAILAIAAIGVVAIRRDRGLRRLRAQAVHQNDLLNTIIDAIPDTLVVFNAQGRMVLSNAVSRELFGQPAENLEHLSSNVRGRYLVDGVTPYPLDRLPVHMARGVQPRETAEMVVQLHDRPDKLHFSLSASRFADAQGRVLGTVVIGRDITELRQTEQQLGEARKMEAVGRLTGGVAHDFNNLLTVIVGSADTLLDELPPGSPGRPLVEMTLKAAERGASLTRAMLAFARRQPLLPRAVDINALLASIKPLMQGSVGATVKVDYVRADNPWPCLADPGQLEVALLNLALNARDAMPGGGTLTVTTANEHVDHVPGDQLAAGDYLCIAVADTGQGMTAEVLARAVEPFFTTKPPGMGTGLGLSMVHGFATQSGGRLVLDSQPGRGTTARLYLPRYHDPLGAQPESPPPSLPDVPGGQGQKILAVEDDPVLREQVGRQLRALGYEPVLASQADRALALLDTGLKPDLLFTDIVMPGGMNGLELAAEARRRLPGLHVLLTTGHAGGTASDAPALPSGARLLSKPYRVADLARAIWAALA